MPFDRRLLGTNLPAWVGPERMTDPAFQAEAVATGTSLLRMPGGSWSNEYDWLGCENSDETTCLWTWAARPADFIDFLQATDLPGMWTVSANDTAESAAALVAYFNGEVDDERPIGTDRLGRDWETVGTWARLRANNGNPAPHDIGLWEFGNEVYGSQPEFGGSECAGFGWEVTWTCDGSEYIEGDADHDGYLAVREAMLAVDPTIEIGAVGVGRLGEWSNWGNEVIDGAGPQLDFYVVHDYGFDGSPSGAEALQRPAAMWPSMLAEVTSRLRADVPVAVTEYNLVSFEAGDTEQTMTQAMNALFIADSIGQLAVNGASIANQWNIANGTTSSGTDYGLIRLDAGGRSPQFDALSTWARVGEVLYPIDAGFDSLRVYPTLHANGDWTVILINLDDKETIVDFDVVDAGSDSTIAVDGVRASALNATELLPIPTQNSTTADDVVSVKLPAWSLSTLDITLDEQ
jgi:hypothetical protein